MGTQAMMHDGYSPQPGGVLLSNVNYIPPGLEGRFKDPFSYNVIFDAIGAGAAQTRAANVQNDSYFVCTQQMMEIWDSATGNTTRTDPVAAPMLARISDSSSGKFMMDQPTPVANLFGSAEQPKVWLYRAKLYLPGGQITMELTNGMATSQRVRVTFEGFKVYNMPDELARM